METEKTDEYFGFIVRITPLYKPFTHRKMNGWNLQPSPVKRQENDLNQTSMISMLVFRGIFANIYHKNQLNIIGKYTLHGFLWKTGNLMSILGLLRTNIFCDENAPE